MLLLIHIHIVFSSMTGTKYNVLCFSLSKCKHLYIKDPSSVTMGGAKGRVAGLTTGRHAPFSSVLKKTAEEMGVVGEELFSYK